MVNILGESLADGDFNRERDLEAVIQGELEAHEISIDGTTGALVFCQPQADELDELDQQQLIARARETYDQHHDGQEPVFRYLGKLTLGGAYTYQQDAGAAQDKPYTDSRIHDAVAEPVGSTVRSEGT